MTGGRASATSTRAPRGRGFTNVALVVAALALGLGLAFALHVTIDNESATREPAGEGVRGSLAHALANREGAIGPSTSDSTVAIGAPVVEPPSVAAPTPDAAVEAFLALEVAEDYDGSYGALSDVDRSNATSAAAWAAQHASLPAITGYEITAVQQGTDRADVSARLVLRLNPRRAMWCA